MNMIVEQNHCINPERPLLVAFANGRAQENAGGIRTKNRGALFRYHREKEGTAGNISAPKVGHKRNTEIKLKNVGYAARTAVWTKLILARQTG
jgi:hypothetical protein